MLTLCFRGSLATKCVFMNNQQCSVRPTLIDLYLEELHYYPFILSMSRCDGSCNNIEDPFGRICVKMEDMNLKVFDMIKWINESKTTKRTPCEIENSFHLLYWLCNTKLRKTCVHTHLVLDVLGTFHKGLL